MLFRSVDAIVMGVGSSGTAAGFCEYLEEQAPNVEIILADPVGSILAEYINEGTLSTKSSSWLVEGIGEDFIPDIANFSRVTKAYSISDAESFAVARELLRAEGILGGCPRAPLQPVQEPGRDAVRTRPHPSGRMSAYRLSDRKSTRLNSSHSQQSRMPSSA